MSKVYKRKDRDKWIADFRDHRGKRKRQTAKTRGEAEDLLAAGIKAAKEKSGDARLDEKKNLEEYAAE